METVKGNYMVMRKVCTETPGAFWHIGDFDTMTQCYTELRRPRLYAMKAPLQEPPLRTTVSQAVVPRQASVAVAPAQIEPKDTLGLVVEEQKRKASGEAFATTLGPSERQVQMARKAIACPGCGRVTMCVCGVPTPPAFEEVLKIQRLQGKMA
jgi:hypothetical protein